MQLVEVTGYVSTNFNVNKPAGMVKKAFDTVWHRGLVFNVTKMELTEISPD